jgi:ADP-dependent NAD(P)H-hydrate dehydratase / NAD(P)H-hydrate epimerase
MQATPLMTVAQCRWLDSAGAKAAGLSSAELMERAGRAAAHFALQRWPLADRFLLLCGSGNNAGDGYVCARYLQQAGREVTLVATASANTPDAALNAKRWEELGAILSAEEFLASSAAHSASYDLVIDALFGIGLRSAPRSTAAALLQFANALPAAKFALDVPSGLDADSGALLGACAFKADATLSFIADKRGLHTAAARSFTGEVHIDTLGLPQQILAEPAPSAYLLRAAQRHIPARAQNSHKGQHGHVLLIGGRLGFGGAVLLSAEAAVCSGAGFVSVLTPLEHMSALLQRVPEAMWIDPQESQASASAFARASVIGIGPGLGQDAAAQNLMARVLAWQGLRILDADALNLLAQAQAAVLGPQSVITPHPGEAARLLGVTVQQIERDRFAAVDALTQRYQCVVVLKGAGTLIGAPERSTMVCGLGNAGLASAGMGDVLTGCISALLAQAATLELDVFDAAAQGVLAHAFAADTLIAEIGADASRGLRASTLAAALRYAVNTAAGP